ncbi:MAG: GNAT family N-acetyltransferase [Pseudomonadota bacterium]
MTLLRAARSTDAGAVGGILTEFAADTAWMPKLHTAAEDVSHAGKLIERGWVTVAERAGKVVGFTAYDAPDLDSLYVAAGARGTGVGTALLIRILQRAETVELWTFQANGSAQDFYRAHGFEEIARTDGARNDEKLPDIQYRWQRETAA